MVNKLVAYKKLYLSLDRTYLMIIPFFTGYDIKYYGMSTSKDRYY